MVKLLNLVKVNIATTGTGTVTFGSAFSNAFFTPSEAGAADGDSVSYVLVEGDDTEIGTGVIGSSVTTMTRTVLKSKISGVAGTTKMTLGGTAWLAFTALGRDIFGKIVVQKFTASGTYTPSANLIYAQIECVGGGGGGGGASGSASDVYAGGGGGAGSYSRTISTAASIGASKAVTIGAGGSGGNGANNGSSGGDTSVDTLCVGKGGGGGTYGSSSSVPTGGSGGTSGTGDITTIGAPGLPGVYNNASTTAYTRSGTGGSSYFGGGAPGGSGTGNTATGYGGGGSGALVFNSGTTATGGAGGSGFVVITEFCSS